MEKIKEKKSLLCLFFKIFGQKGKDFIIRRQAEKKLLNQEVDFNNNFFSGKNILIILPDSILEALYQVENVLSIMSKYKNSDTYILTGDNCSLWFNNFHGIKKLFEYNTSVDCFFDTRIKELKNDISDYSFNSCFILDKNPSDILKYLLTQIEADFRISYEGSLKFPFANIRIKGNKKLHSVDYNLSLCRTLNIPLHDKLHWSVSKDRIEEISHIMSEQGIRSEDKPACIDIDYFVKKFGKKWSQKLIESIIENLTEYKWYIYVDNANDPKYADWLRSFDLPCFIGFSPTRLTALLHRSVLLISGKSYLFELSYLLKRKAAGFFEEDELKSNCRLNEKSRGYDFVNKPNDEDINNFIDLIKK